MGVLRRLADARNTVEGKFLSVLMAALLVVSTFSVSAWAADTAQETSRDAVTEVNDKAASEQPAAEEPEKKAEAEKPAPAPEPEKPAAEPEAQQPAASLETPAPRPDVQEPATAPADAEEEPAADIALKLQVTNATLSYGGKAVAADAKELVVPANEDVKIAVAAADGFQLGEKAVKLVNAAGVECVIAVNAAGEYVVKASELEAGDTIVVTADPAAAAEPEAPADEPADEPTTPEVTEPVAPVAPTTPEAPATTDQPGALDSFLDLFGASTLSIKDESGKTVKSISLEAGWAKSVRSDKAGSNYREHSWNSSNPKVAAVSGSGESAQIVGVSEGKATITHNYQEKSWGEWRDRNETISVTVTKRATAPTVTYNANGGEGADTTVSALWGSVLERYAVTLPDPSEIGFSREGYTFVGWSTEKNGRGSNYVANSEFPVTENTTVYAIWLDDNSVATSGTTAYFYIRKDGNIQKEPANYDGSNYNPPDVEGKEPALKGSLRQPVAVNNDFAAIKANLKDVPSDEKIKSVLAQYDVDFDPETQYIQWYVIKARGKSEWNVDGVIQYKSKKLVSYEANGGVANKVPAAVQYTEGADVQVDFGTGTHIPERTGYKFLGWDENSSATTPTYPVGVEASFTMPDHDVTLYAIWQERGAVAYTYAADPAEVGAVSRSYEAVNPVTGNAEGSTATAAKGYQFIGWFEGNEQITAENAAQHNVTLSTDGATLVPQKAKKDDGSAYEGGRFTAKFERDDSQTKKTSYVVEHVVDGEVRDSATYEGVAWVNDDPAMIDVVEGSLSQNTYVGYKFDKIEGAAADATEVVSGTTVKLIYVRDDSKTQDVFYTVKYTIGGVEQADDTVTVKSTVWVNDPEEIAIADGGVPAPADKYVGYKLDPANPEYPAAGTLVPSGTEYTVNYVVRDDVEYKVEHYTQNLSRDGYELTDTVTYNTGVTNEEVTAEPKEYVGFTLNPSAAGAVPSGVVAGDGSLVLKLYYDRNAYTVTYQVTGDYFANEAFLLQENVPFGTELSLIKDDMQKQGYVWHDWTGLPTTMPDRPVVVTGFYTPADDTAYTVEHWFQNVEGNEYTKNSDLDQKLTGTTGEQTAAVAKEVNGFAVQPFSQQEIAANGSTVVRIYYDRNVYKVTYNYGDAPAGASTLPEMAEYRFGANVEVAPAATAPGYTFNGWSYSGTFPMPASDVTITGTWTAKGDTPYRVEYYTRGVSVSGAPGEYTQHSADDLTGQTGTVATAVIKDIEGFRHNPDAEGTKLSGAIAGDGSLVLKVYYDRMTYRVTYDYGEPPAGASSLPRPLVAQYGQTVEVAPAATAPGYTFFGWDRKDFEMPAEPVTIRGTWTANPASIQFVANGGSAVEPMNGVTDEKIESTAMPETTREGYVFAGWYGNKDLSGEAVEELPSSYPIGITTYYAKWDIRTDLGYTVNYYRDAIGEDNLITSETGVGTFQAAIPYDVETNAPYGFTAEGATVTGQGIITADADANVINVVYPRNAFTITASIDANGAIAGEANQTVLFQGASQAISFSANEGYRIDSVTVTETTADGDIVRNLTPTGTALDYTFDAIDSVEGNYTVRVITAPLDAVTLTVPSAARTYNGQELTAQTFTVNGLPEGYAVAGNVVGSRTNVGTTIAYVDMDSVVIRDASGADVTERFRSVLSQTVGTLTINPAPVTVTAVDATKVAGAADPAFTAQVEGLVPGEPASLISYLLTREVGEAAGAYAVIPSGNELQGNYEVTYVPGTLTITEAPVVPGPDEPTTPVPPVTPDDPTTPVTPDPTPTPAPAPTPTPTPTPTPAPAPATPAPAAAGPAPAAAAVVPAAAAAVPAAAETILDDATPLAYAGADDAEDTGAVETIADDETPMAAFDHPHCWVHYWIFLGIFLTLVYAVAVIARRLGYVRKIDKFEDDLTGGQVTGDARATKPLAGGMEA